MPIYMQIENISGSVTAQDYKNWIALKSVDFGADRPISTKPGNVTNRESSKPNINEINITKALDNTTPYIFSQACAGTGKTIKIDICNTGNTPYLELTLSNALISSHSVASVDTGSTVDHIELMKIYALNYSGIPIIPGPWKTVSGEDKKLYIYQVSGLKQFLLFTFGNANEVIKNPKPTDLHNVKGILIFTVTVWLDASGHATLWDGRSCSDHCYFPIASEASIWSLK